MNKTGIKTFAIWARRKLIKDITTKCSQLGITEKGIAKTLPQSTSDIKFFDIGTKEYAQLTGNEIIQRESLASHIRNKENGSDFETAFKSVVEEVAYTWFNRLIAIRFMEVNDYLPSRIRVLSSENAAKSEPDFVTAPFDTDLEFTPYERDRVIQLKDENKLDILFRMLFIKQCNKLNENLPELFENTDDYTELLLTISFTDTDGVVYHLVHDIDEDDFNIEKEGQIEIIGWMYQYYNTELKDEVFALLKKNVKITKERIPAATQLFTPDWIVRYMVENSLGRLWIEGHPDNTLKSNWKYYLDEAEQEPDVQIQLEKIRSEYKSMTPKDIKVIDPCMGSGHILVYAFDVLMQIYTAYGYTHSDAAVSIAENNIYGLDIDERAYQLAYFAVMMKVRQYDRQFLNKNIKLNLCAINDTKNLHRDSLKLFGKLEDNATRLADEFIDAKEYGSILNLNITNDELALLSIKTKEICNTEYNNFFDYARTAGIRTDFKPLVKQAEIMTRLYDVVVTNPPYMGSSGMSEKLSEHIKKYYPDSKSDLFAVFIEKCGLMTMKNRYQAMITQHAWMFLSSFEKLREKMLLEDTVNMTHLGARAFEEIGGEVVQTTSFVTRNSNIKNYKSTYMRLLDYKSQQAKEEAFFVKQNSYIAQKENFLKIPGSPIAYWVSESVINAFKKSESMGNLVPVKKGMDSGDNDRFIRLWHEINFNNTNIVNKIFKWVPYNKGGNFRKWFGNNEYVINWEHDGIELKNSKANLRSKHLYFKKSITWNALSSANTCFRFCDNNSIFDSAGSSLFPNEKDLLYFLGLLNSKQSQFFLNIINPTLNYGAGSMALMPILKQNNNTVNELVKQNIFISKTDWDSFETSWNFIRHPLISRDWLKECFKQNDMNSKTNYYPLTTTINTIFENGKVFTEKQFTNLKKNEVELNTFFINLYALNDELTIDVEDKDVTVARIYDTKEDIPESMKGNNYVMMKSDVIKSFISYAVGCMFGRYSLDIDGLAYAGGEWDDSKYKTYIPDADNCIPITDEDYFTDDIVGRFTEFVKMVYGAETLEENLDFIANALENTGNTSREKIRNYFLKDFYNNHCKIYQKRPIYWLFDSGKENGFKALIYMHRYNADTVGNMRIEYLHRMQRIYDSEMIRMQEIIDNSTNVRDIAAAQKRKDKMTKQLKETRDYDVKIAHLALARIEIDLDDGVKVNYVKVQTDTNGRILDVLAKI